MSKESEAAKGYKQRNLTRVKSRPRERLTLKFTSMNLRPFYTAGRRNLANVTSDQENKSFHYPHPAAASGSLSVPVTALYVKMKSFDGSEVAAWQRHATWTSINFHIPTRPSFRSTSSGWWYRHSLAVATVNVLNSPVSDDGKDCERRESFCYYVIDVGLGDVSTLYTTG